MEEIEGLSVKQLRAELDTLAVNFDDCIEKSDLQAKLREYIQQWASKQVCAVALHQSCVRRMEGRTSSTMRCAAQ